jgi:RNA polymerase sigma factor (sigma-70 family)
MRALSRRSLPVDLPPFQRLLDAHGADVWRYLCARLGRSAAEDAYQDTMLAALRAYPTLRDASNLRAWLLTIAANKATDAERARGRAPRPVAEVQPDAVEPIEPSDDGVWRAVRALPDGQRDAVTLRYGADLSYRDVAALLGCSEEAARQRVRTGLASLRDMEVRR